MSRWLRDFRLMPIVLIAIGCLFALKTFGLVSDGGYTLGQRLGGASGALVVTTVPGAPVTQLRSPSVPLEVASGQAPKSSWMQEMFNYPGDITGAITTTKAAEKAALEKAEAAAAKDPPAEPGPDGKAAGTVIALDQPRSASAGERALLERLQTRRQELDARARELDLRESMLKAAEKKLEIQAAVGRAEEIKGGAPNGSPAGSMAQRKEEMENARFKSVVTMYETMKPKEAAKIFDRLDIKVLLEVASQIKPQRMSEIMAQMTPEAAERLTVELAARSGMDRSLNPSNLPKIEGRPGG
jgi:flagellar motility protein MotE (MotC chaperone)